MARLMGLASRPQSPNLDVKSVIIIIISIGWIIPLAWRLIFEHKAPFDEHMKAAFERSISNRGLLHAGWEISRGLFIDDQQRFILKTPQSRKDTPETGDLSDVLSAMLTFASCPRVAHPLSSRAAVL